MEAGESVTHDLKVWSGYFESLLDGTKNFEVRFNDRDFKSGHYLRLREWLNNEYTGRELTKRVTYVLQGGVFGLEAGYVALALAAKQSELATLLQQQCAPPATEPREAIQPTGRSGLTWEAAINGLRDVLADQTEDAIQRAWQRSRIVTAMDLMAANTPTPPAPEVGETGEVDPSPPRPAQEPKCFPNAIHRCSNCQSEGLEWGSYVQLVAAGMGPDKAKPIFTLGCVDCSETLRVVDAEDVATWMNKQMSTATPPAQGPGHVDELVHCLRIREQSLGSEGTNLVQLRDAAFFGRAATRLEQQEAELAALVQQLAEPAKALVVPVNEQPWDRPGWCDAEGRCWLCNSYSMGRWNYDTPPDPAQDWGRLGTVTHSAPHWAIPRPGRMPELPSLSVYSYDAGESVRISRMGESNCWCIIASGLVPDWWFNLEMHYDFASAGAALAAIRLARQIAKKSEEA
jgi:hypothetical protein